MAGIEVTDDPDRFGEAIRQFRKRVPVPESVWDAMVEQEREFAFKVSGVAQADLVADAWEAIDRAIKDGTTLDDFKREIGERLEAAWGGEDAARLETIFRTNTLGAYNAGRHEILTHPAVKKSRPYWRFDDVDDNRECDICSPAHGTVLPADDPAWESIHPPLHFSCRCQITPLTPDEAEDEGIDDEAPDVEADDGFGAPPTVGGDWEPDISKYPDSIAEILQDRLES